MKQAGLLYKRPESVKGRHLWVSDLVSQPQGYFSYLEFDIKYVWIAGQRRDALVLSVIDVFNRWLIFYNYERIHSGINYLSPCKYLLSMGVDIVKEIELKKALATEPRQ